MDTSITVTSPGVIINFGAASANVGIPNTSAGTPPKYVRLISTAACYVRVSKGVSAAVAGDLMVQPADSVIVRTHGLDTVDAIQVSAAGILQISPLEDQ